MKTWEQKDNRGKEASIETVKQLMSLKPLLPSPSAKMSVVWPRAVPLAPRTAPGLTVPLCPHGIC